MTLGNRSFLTTIIGFLLGYLFYLSVDQSTIYLFLFGGMGYLVGLFLDGFDRKNQINQLHYASLNPSEEIFTTPNIPEAVIIYSKHENKTTVMLEYQVEAKPPNFRLSVLKNFQEFEFRIIEDSKNTLFNLTITFPNLNFPTLKEMHLNDFFFDIHERGFDFKNAVQKVVPGLLLTPVVNPNAFSDITETSNYTYSNIFVPSQTEKLSLLSGRKIKPKTEPSSAKELTLNNLDAVVYDEISNYPIRSDIGENEVTKNYAYFPNSTAFSTDSTVNETEIIRDLLAKPESNEEPLSSPAEEIPDISPEEALQLKGLNDRKFAEFLNSEEGEILSLNKEQNKSEDEFNELPDDIMSNKILPKDSVPESVKIDFSSLNIPQNAEGLHKFNETILSRINTQLETCKPLSEKYKLLKSNSSDD
ncbi:MAG: hypothetical protein EAX86_05810 [Candidatus Heimdallarchaeota archaeon]|nr:hypothetical protein [Candidatus Heimdallarchaeota archaeon]